MGLIRFIQDHNRNVELKKMRQLEENKRFAPKRYCPDCGREIPFDAKLCPYCGKKF